jgi:hypothetical protein
LKYINKITKKVGGIVVWLSKIQSSLKAIQLTKFTDIEIRSAFASDLMSDVLSLVDGDVVLLTGLTNIQTIRTAEMKDIKCIVFVRGKIPDKSVIILAEEKGICLLSTKYIMFYSCGILFDNGLLGAEIEA